MKEDQVKQMINEAIERIDQRLAPIVNFEDGMQVDEVVA